MARTRNIFACLVHESPECVFDLVRNLHFLDPCSVILLYNGGQMPGLLETAFPFEQYGAILHPSPRGMTWGRLHNFALDCMQFALDEIPFETLTIVDSDQLGTRPRYSEFLGNFLKDRNDIGVLGSSCGVVHQTTQLNPAQAAFKEVDLWLRYLQRFPQGEEKFVHWSFWPATVFTCDAASDLVRLFTTDSQLLDLMAQTRIWATEEVILPTLVAALGYETAINPCSYDYVQYRTCYTPAQIDLALSRGDVFWVHPIPRNYTDGLRKRIREQLGDYRISSSGGSVMTQTDPKGGLGLVLSVPILDRMRKIRGWLEDEEADLLIASSSRALSSLPTDAAVVEIGSFCGRSTIVLGSVIKALGVPTRIYAIDPHDGVVGSADSGTQTLGPTLAVFQRNIGENELTSVVEVMTKRSFEVDWDKPIAFLFIDGLHDYGNVSRDFQHFEPWVVPGGYIAFHDYAEYYPGVKILMDEILALPQFERVCSARSMIVIRKNSTETAVGVGTGKDRLKAPNRKTSPRARPSSDSKAVTWPLVSCIMPTADRRSLVPQAIRHFLRQDYPNRELIIVDDGLDNIADLVPDDERIHYTRLAQRLSMGAKHNLACELARGEVIAHWDDDDWIAPWRLSYQVRELDGQSPETLCGLARVLFYEPRSERAWEYAYPEGGRPWVLGATFCYFRRFWEYHRFPDMNEGADTVFVWNLQNVNVLAHQEHTFYVGTVHATNTSPKRTETQGWRPLASQDIRCLLDDQDWSFYRKFGSQ